MSGVNYIHLRTHSSYSLAEGAIKIPQLMELCKHFKMPALALTDSNNMFGALEFSLSAAKSGIQPIVGCTFYMAPLDEKKSYDLQTSCFPLVMLAQNETGYYNLLKMASFLYLEARKKDPTSQPMLHLKDWYGKSEGILCLTGGFKGELYRCLQAGEKDQAVALLDIYRALFPDRLYIELNRHGREDKAVEELLIDLAYDHHIPLVATNEIFFAHKDLYEAHDALLCISEGTYVTVEERRQETVHHYFKSAEEMVEIFADLPEATQNTVLIAKRCSYMPKVSKPVMPEFKVPEGQDEAGVLRTQAREGLKQKIERHLSSSVSWKGREEEMQKTYEERLEHELTIIINMGFAGYFLIVSDFVKWAKAHHIPVGPGRGSGAGSLVAWALEITGIDPIRFGLLFERFLNPERVSMPDFDIDFCQERRDEVIEYVCQKYGQDRVAHIITFGKLQARAVLRDVGRVLQLPYTQVDRICKLVPNNPAHPVSLDEALEREVHLKQLVENDPTLTRLVSIARHLEGLYRHASTHAAGVVISREKLTNYIPLYQDARSYLPATQFSMKYVELAGLVKFDFLGLKTLTVIRHAINLLQQQGVNLDIDTIPLDDFQTLELLRLVKNVVGIFQLESSGMQDVLRKLKPERFEEIIALVALYRPGPMMNIPKYLACKHGQEEVNCLHPMLEDILKETFGVMIYQEQVMEIARVMACYTLGEADILRRAMGKKIQKEMDAQRSKFIKGAREKGVDEATADLVFDQMSKFAGYGFNKSHSASYALLTYQTAYLKAHYPVEFMCATMALDYSNIDKITIYRKDLVGQKIDLLPPDINESEANFKGEEGKRAIRYGLAVIKNVGLNAMEMVVQERKKNGPYKDIFDFIQRLDSRVLNKRQFENLILAGAFDSLHRNRCQLFENVDLLLSSLKNKGPVTGYLFQDTPHLSLKEIDDWSPLERLQKEFEALGFYFSSHPLDNYDVQDLKALPSSQLLDFVYSHEGEPFNILGVLITTQVRTSKNGQLYAFITLSDQHGEYEAILFSENYNKYRDLLIPGEILKLQVSGRFENDSLRLLTLSIEPLAQLLEMRPVVVSITSSESLPRLSHFLEEKTPGSTEIFLKVPLNENEKAIVRLPKLYKLSLKDRALLQSFK